MEKCKLQNGMHSTMIFVLKYKRIYSLVSAAWALSYLEGFAEFTGIRGGKSVERYRERVQGRCLIFTLYTLELWLKLRQGGSSQRWKVPKSNSRSIIPWCFCLVLSGGGSLYINNNRWTPFTVFILFDLWTGPAVSPTCCLEGPVVFLCLPWLLES